MGMHMSNAERYLVKAAELKAAAQVQAEYYLRSEFEYLASVYLVLADKEDANCSSEWWRKSQNLAKGCPLSGVKRTSAMQK
jgi:hypothetical protein